MGLYGLKIIVWLVNKMDTSEEYIKMCRRLPKEVHGDIIDGDFYYWKLTSQEDGTIHISYTEIFEDYIVHHPEQWDYLNGREIIKLYRQDQLQDMVATYLNRKSHGVLYDFIDWMEDLSTSDTRDHRDYSIEQLWLVYVMHEVYVKQWNDKDWVVE